MKPVGAEETLESQVMLKTGPDVLDVLVTGVVPSDGVPAPPALARLPEPGSYRTVALPMDGPPWWREDAGTALSIGKLPMTSGPCLSEKPKSVTL